MFPFIQSKLEREILGRFAFGNISFLHICILKFWLGWQITNYPFSMPAEFKVFWPHRSVNLGGGEFIDRRIFQKTSSHLPLIVQCTVCKTSGAFCWKKRGLDQQPVTNLKKLSLKSEHLLIYSHLMYLTFILQFHQDNVVFYVAFGVAEFRIFYWGVPSNLQSFSISIDLLWLLVFCTCFSV